MQKTNGGGLIRLFWYILKPTRMGTGDTPNSNGDNGIPTSGGPPPNPTPPTCDNV